MRETESGVRKGDLLKGEGWRRRGGGKRRRREGGKGLKLGY